MYTVGYLPQTSGKAFIIMMCKEKISYRHVGKFIGFPENEKIRQSGENKDVGGENQGHLAL